MASAFTGQRSVPSPCSARGRDGGHVGVVQGVDRHGNPIIVSGNHGHRVGVGTYPRSRVIAYVVPTDCRLPARSSFVQRIRSTHRPRQPNSPRSAERAAHLARRMVRPSGCVFRDDSGRVSERTAAHGPVGFSSRARHGRFESAFAEYRVQALLRPQDAAITGSPAATSPAADHLGIDAAVGMAEIMQQRPRDGEVADAGCPDRRRWRRSARCV